MDREAICGAVARGWCWPINSHKTMDVELAHAITEEIWQADWTPNLGCATTRELLDEIRARIEIDGKLDYKTVT